MEKEQSLQVLQGFSAESSTSVKPEDDIIHMITSTHQSLTIGWNSEDKEAYDHGNPIRPSYEVEIYLPSIGWKQIYRGLGLCTRVTGLHPDCIYQFRVRKIHNGAGEGSWSKISEHRTEENPPSAFELYHAIQYGGLEKAQKILTVGPQCRDLYNDHGLTPLMMAANLNKTEFVLMLLEAGADPNQPSSLVWRTALMIAAYAGHLEVVKILSRNGASWSCKDKSGCNALHYSVDGGHTEVVEFALRNGAVRESQDHSGWTALTRAVLLGSSAEVVQLLLHEGANVNATDKTHKTCLMHAVLKGKEDVVKSLVKCGASLSAKSESGHTAYDMARARGMKSLLQLLEPKK